MNTIEVTIKFDTPFMTAGEGNFKPGIDSVQAVDGSGKAVIPGTHIKGHLREIFMDLVCAAQSDLMPKSANDSGKWYELTKVAGLIFGSPKLGSGTPLRSQVTVGNFHVTEDKPEKLNRIAIDGVRGATQDKALAFIESSGYKESVWKGEISFNKKVHDVDITPIIHACLKMLEGRSIGKQKGIGWGRINKDIKLRKKVSETEFKDVQFEFANVEAELKKLIDYAKSEDSGKADGKFDFGKGTVFFDKEKDEKRVTESASLIRYRIKLTEPLLIVNHTAPASNVLESLNYIPGSAIRHALASAINGGNSWIDRNGGKHDWFFKIAVRHALPIKKDSNGYRPLPVPFCAFSHKRNDKNTENEKDGWESALVTWLNHKNFNFGNGKHQSDIHKDGWLQSDKCRNPYNPPRFKHTHVATDATTGSAGEGLLYTYRAIRECGSEGDTYFVGVIVVPKDVVSKVKEELVKINRIGKNRGTGGVEIEIVDENYEQPEFKECSFNDGKYFVLTLRTDALLLPQGTEMKFPDKQPKEHYETFFEGELKVKPTHIFAHHIVRGGKTSFGPVNAPPLVLTKAGSTFVFVGLSDDAVNKLKEWAKWGLVNEEALKFAGDVVWAKIVDEKSISRFVPYQPENGYGEVVINDPWVVDCLK